MKRKPLTGSLRAKTVRSPYAAIERNHVKEVRRALRAAVRSGLRLRAGIERRIEHGLHSAKASP